MAKKASKSDFESFDLRMERYKKAEGERNLYLTNFQQAYRLALPERNKWDRPETKSGQLDVNKIDKSNRQYDHTAVAAVPQFASNLQQMFMPTGREWWKYKQGTVQNGKHYTEQQLEDATKQVSQYISRSNLMMQANLALQDTAISTGMIKVNVGKKEDYTPITYEAIPMHQVAFSEYNGKIENVWRKFKIRIGDIESTWAAATLTGTLARELSKDPNNEIELIESTIFYPDNEEAKQYLYCVSHEESHTDLVFEPRSWSPWIAARFNVAVGETWGAGPVRTGLSIIRLANIIARFEMEYAGYNVPMLLMRDVNSIINPHNIEFRGGTMVDVNDISRPPLETLKLTGDLNFVQLSLPKLQQDIRDMLFADPLGPVGNDQTATEVSIRDKDALKRNTGAFTRMESELVRPLLMKTTQGLNDLGLLRDIGGKEFNFKIDGNFVDIEINSPLMAIQKQENFQNITTFYQTLIQTLGPQLGVMATKVEFLPGLLAEELDIPVKLLENEGVLAQAVQQMKQQMGQPQQPQGVPPQAAAPAQVQGQQQPALSPQQIGQ